MPVAALILAAGASSRMGAPKALLDYRGETFVDRLRRLFAAHCGQVLVVGAPSSPFAVDVVNPHPERGMLSSLQAGLAAVAPGVDAALFTLVDQPAIDESTVGTMVQGWGGEVLRIPRFEGRRGHPVLVARALFHEFLACEGTPRDVVSRHESEIVYVDVDDPGILLDADTPHDYQKLIAHG